MNQRTAHRRFETASIATLHKWISLLLAYQPKRRAKELDVWNQIRRTEEEPMEMGIKDNTPLHDHGAGTEGRVSTVGKLSKIGA